MGKLRHGAERESFKAAKERSCKELVLWILALRDVLRAAAQPTE